MGAAARQVTADAGYFSEANLTAPQFAAIDVLCPAGSAPSPSREPSAGRSRQGPFSEAMRSKLQTAAGRAVYARRKTIPEPVFGQIKQARGFRRFWLRGVGKVRGEWALICLTHNLLKLFRARIWPRPRRNPHAAPSLPPPAPSTTSLPPQRSLGWSPSLTEPTCWRSRVRLPRQAPSPDHA